MISEARVLELINEKIEGTDLFLVELTITTSNQINVLVDGMNGLGIDDCVAISRQIEHNLDREQEDFELQVSSPGLDHPFKVIQQYEKNIGRDVKIYTQDGRKHEGELVEVDPEKAVIRYEEKVRIEGRKKKELVERVETYYFESESQEDKIKETKVIISFK